MAYYLPQNTISAQMPPLIHTINTGSKPTDLFKNFYETIVWQPVHSQPESFHLNHSQLLLLSAVSDKFFIV